MKVRSAHAFVGHNVPITIFRVDTAYYPIVNFGMSHRDLCHQPARELVRLMSDRAVSCREVIEAAVAGYLEKVFGGWRPPSIVTTVA
jgi:hypothetical protein